jgi:hypothetical protein
LKKHQKTAKFCLEIQGCIGTIICEYCNKNLSSNERLYTHYNVCKEKSRVEITKFAYSEHTHLNQTIKLLTDNLADARAKYEKMEVKLQKFENAILHIINASQNDTKQIPLKEQIQTIIYNLQNDEKVSPLIVNHTVIHTKDLYINAKHLANATGKIFNEWLSMHQTKELISLLSTEINISQKELVQEEWIHPDLAIHFAQWISPQCYIQVNKWLKTHTENSVRKKDERIKKLENVCLRKHSRTKYPCKNVIYILTTEDHLKNRTYIIGKAKNLTSRLSTYNKTCDHHVIYYIECGENMNLIETMAISKLNDYKQVLNRDRFILPEDKDISFFIDVVKKCADFYKS